MGLETATYIHELDASNPVGATDPKSQGDNHLRLIKSALQNTLPNVEGAVTASHTELNVLDGVTANTAELNILDGVTATAAELNKLDGLTASTTELNTLTGITATVAELNKLSGVPAGLTSTEIGYLDGVTSSIQTQLNLNTSGTYTAVVSNTVNIDSTVVKGAQFIRVNNVVTVSGIITVDATTASTATSFQITLPIASNLANDFQLAGTGVHNFSNPVAVNISGNAGNNSAQFNFIANTTSGVDLPFQFTYLII